MTGYAFKLQNGPIIFSFRFGPFWNLNAYPVTWLISVSTVSGHFEVYFVPKYCLLTTWWRSKANLLNMIYYRTIRQFIFLNFWLVNQWKRAKNEVNQAFQQLCALLEKRKTAMINQIQTDVNEHVGILTDMCTRWAKKCWHRHWWQSISLTDLRYLWHFLAMSFCHQKFYKILCRQHEEILSTTLFPYRLNENDHFSRFRAFWKNCYETIFR